MARRPIGLPSRPRFGLRGHVKCGGSDGGGPVVRPVPPPAARVTAWLVAPVAPVPAPGVPAKIKDILIFFNQ